jgi:hypothetical protein
MGWRHFKRHLRFDPGVGSRISFWEETLVLVWREFSQRHVPWFDY